MLLAMAGLFVSDAEAVIYTAIALIGFGNSNIFSIIFSQALLAVPEKKNEISGLMIMDCSEEQYSRCSWALPAMLWDRMEL